MHRLPQWIRPFRHQSGFAPSYSTGETEDTEGEFIPPIDFLENLESAMSNDKVIPNLCHRFRPYRFYSSREKWKHLQTPVDDIIHDMIDNPSKRYPSYLKIITWNIDFVTPQKEERLRAALRHIQWTLGCKKETDMPEDPVCIMLQEIHRDVFQTILDDEWVRKCFIVAPDSPELWPDDALYGNVTLVSKRLTLVKCQILHFAKTTMQRAALAVYVLLSEPEPSEDVAMICLVNTHLESLPEGFPYRPEQLKLAAGFLKQEDVRGGVVAGDMNAIMPEDANLHADVQLRDAWRRGDHDEEGFTWGYQETFNPGRYPHGRLDKVLYLPRRGYKVEAPHRLGAGLKTKSGHWVSDHYGLETTLRLVARRNSGGTS
ncbi:Endonuclease/exonuclease/phosphatase [Coprinopsis sp. MPI-PUGE-AT-0042]|nr:Endonuclease/exonuclease/phosphatase [Coprinopsis sp. MPI-PUGE-AT-0042]